jgi:hypothetical protein
MKSAGKRDHAEGEQGSVVANRKPGSPKDPQAETPVEAVRRFQRDYPLDTSDPYTKLFALLELRTARLRQLRESAEALVARWNAEAERLEYDMEYKARDVADAHADELEEAITACAEGVPETTPKAHALDSQEEDR